jgi:hypothetical protein
MQVANNPANILGTDWSGNIWAAANLSDGKQIWVQIRDGQITNGGINPVPRVFNPSTGLSASSAKGG